ncbi:hypothetical protein MKX01_011620 [Papaver californicum]|nr:hypothetical protein MKX01_011620 [Papaver californicum]
MLPLLHCQDLYQLFDPKFPIPPATLTDPTTNQPTKNPFYNQWRKTDQLFLLWINATLTEPILAQVVGLNTAREVWDYLESSFTSNNVAHALQLRIQLHHMQKGNSSITEYLSIIKNISDLLVVASQSVSDLDLVLNALKGLSHEYDAFTIAITGRLPLPTFSELYALLLQQEIRIYHDNIHRVPPENNVASFDARKFNPYRGNNNSNQRGARSSQHLGNGLGRGNGSNGRGRSSHQQPSSSSRSILGAPPTANKPARVICQVCNKPGHSALDCYNRFNQAFQPNDLHKSFAAMQLSSTPYDQHWYLDT